MKRTGTLYLLILAIIMFFQLQVNAQEDSQKKITLSKERVNMAYFDKKIDKMKNGTRVYVDTQKDPNIEWNLSSNKEWLEMIPNTGKGEGYFEVIPKTDGLYNGVYFDENDFGVITVRSSSNTAIPEQEIGVNVDLYREGDNTSSPFGSFDTPESGSTVQSSVPITGWVLDDVGVEKVEIYREENGKNYLIGDAILVDGARPDIETQYPNYPNNSRAGWGYMLLTNFLPNGDGNYKLTAIAHDVEGNQTTLGSKTVTVDNANAVKPFGAIDTPAMGGSASGSSYRCSGWVLTPPPNMMYECGSEINVFIDGMNIGNVTYNGYRSDIASYFPGYPNANGAGAFCEFDTKSFSNGVHTIQWVATDNAGNTDGIGSRFFTIENTNSPAANPSTNEIKVGAPANGAELKPSQIYTTNDTKAVGPYNQYFHITNKGAGVLEWQVETENEWIKLEPTSGTGPGWVQVMIDPSGMVAGVHSGFIKISEINQASPPEYVTVELSVLDVTEPPFGEFVYPALDNVVSGTVNFSGWALDDIGISSIKIFRKNGDENVLVGDAVTVEGARADVQAFYSHYPFADRAGWSYTLDTHDFENGEYTFFAEVTDYEGNVTQLDGESFKIDNSLALLPFGDIDSPTEGQIISGDNAEVTGWVLTELPNQIATDGSTIFVYLNGEFIGKPVYNIYHEGAASKYPGYANAAGAGFSFYLDTTTYPDGVYTLNLMVLDNAGNTNKKIGARSVKIINTIITKVEDDLIVPEKTELMNAYPNPFNPSTQIEYHLANNGVVNVHIYDVLGRKVKTLVDNQYQQAGRYRLSFSTNELTSNVYFCRFTTENQSFVKKLLYLK